MIQNSLFLQLSLVSVFTTICLAADSAPLASGVPTDSTAGPARVWVFFADKGLANEAEHQAALLLAEKSYPQRALQRRAQRRSVPGLVDDRDILVCQRYINDLIDSGAAIRVISPWLNAVSIDATAAQLARVRNLPAVRSIEPVRKGARQSVVPVEQVTKSGNTAPRDTYGYSSAQLAQITVTNMHSAGFTGAGVIVGILDTGFNRSHIAFNQPGHVVNVLAEYDFVKGDANAGPDPNDDPSQISHGTLILGCIAAYLPNTLIGGAYNASFVLAKTEDVTQEVPAEEDNYVAGLQFLESNGADLATSSLGYIDWYTQADLDGATAVTTIAVNTATDNGLICISAAGNAGNDGNPTTSSLIAPADARRVITCGATDVNGVLTSFSSDGPTADGRVKPEVLACGYHTYTVYPYDTTSIAYASGTSLSTPLVAAAVACLVQQHPDWGVAQMRKALMLTANTYVSTGTFDPLFARGYGVINTFNAGQQPGCLGDFNGDSLINLGDLAILLSNYGKVGPVRYKDGDLDTDGDVDLSDLAAFLGAYGGGC